MHEISWEGATVRIRPLQDVTGNAAEALRAKAAEQLGKGPAKLIGDLSNVENLDSLGLSVLIGLHMHQSKHNNLLEVDNASIEIYDLFHSMRLNKHFSISLKE